MKELINLLLGKSTKHAHGDAKSTENDTCKFYSPETPLNYQETVDLMSRGHENTQRTIQFMDAKAGAVVALSLAIYAFIGAVAKWAFEQTDATAIRSLPELAQWSCCILGFLVLTLGFASLYFVFETVRPNQIPGWGAFSTLFPAHDKKNEANAKAYMAKIISGTTQGNSINEIEKQLIVVGQLIYAKINRLRKAVTYLLFQGLAATLLGLLIVSLAITGHLVKTEEPVPTEIKQPTSHSKK